MKQTLLLTGLIIGNLAAVSTTALAESQTKVEVVEIAPTKTTRSPDQLMVSKKQQKANQQAIADRASSQEELSEAINKDAGDGFEKLVEAIELIESNKEEEALKALQVATRKFDAALATNPDLDMIPVAVEVDVIALTTTPDLVKTQVNQARDLLKDSNVQEAIAILEELKDEMVTTITYFPMNTFPDVIKHATKLLLEGQKDEALERLNTEYLDVIEEETIIPLSLLRAEEMISAAAEQTKDKDKALAQLNGAQEQLKLAKSLGYTTEDFELYGDLSKQIKTLKKEAKGPNAAEKLYSKLKSSIESLVNRKSTPTEKSKLESEQ